MAAVCHLGLHSCVSHTEHLHHANLTFTPVGPNFHRFRSKTNCFRDTLENGKSKMATLRPPVSEIKWKTENPRWPPAPILDSILVLVRHHSYTIPTLPLSLGAQIFIGLALRPMVSEIHWKMKNPRWPPATILDSIPYLFHNYLLNYQLHF